MKACNVDQLSTRGIVANLSVKALYEVAKLKMNDPSFKGYTEEQVKQIPIKGLESCLIEKVFRVVRGQAVKCGIRLVH